MSSMLMPCIRILSTKMLLSRCSNKNCENYITALVSKFCPDCGSKSERCDTLNVYMAGELPFDHFYDFSPEFQHVIDDCDEFDIDEIVSVGNDKKYWTLSEYYEYGYYQKDFVHPEKDVESLIAEFKNNPSIIAICNALDKVKPKPVKYDIVYGMVKLK